MSGLFLFCSCLFGVLKTSPCTLITPFFPLRLGNLSAVILLDKLSIPLVCISFSSRPMIWRFGLLMVFQRSCRFYFYFLSISLSDLILLLYLQSLIICFHLVLLH
jgi:hypothetical protein